MNNTKYFEPGRSRLYNTFSSNASYRSRKIKIEGYETRLYWQFRYCQDVNGQVFYYTLTYNDKSIPKFYGVNCFDYEDLRYLLTGGFYQYLRRNYGTKLRYFVGAELGDGKGSRGMHNNPHYHCLFFLEPDKEPLCPYQKISSVDFRHLVRLYWQGFDQDTDGYKDYREAKFGIAKEGDDLGLVSDYRACAYCAKYVIKDVKLVRSEDKIAHYVRFYTNKVYKGSYQSYLDYYRLNRSLLDSHLLSIFPRSAFVFADELGFELCDSQPEFQGDLYKLVKKLDLYEDYCSFVRKHVQEKVDEVLNFYRNRYCNKCRISQGIGKYALSHIDDLKNPSVQVPCKKGFKNRPLPLYLYRKLYTDVVKVDECVVTPRGTRKVRTHSSVRVLNDLGIDLKLSMLPKYISKVAEQARNNLSHLLGDSALYESMRQSDVNSNVTMSYDSFTTRLVELQSEYSLDEILKRYAEFKVVYQDRFFPFQDSGSGPGPCLPVLDLENDYKRFLTSSIVTVSRSDLRLSSFVESDMAGYIPYLAHPYFLRLYSLFAVFDLCADYLFVQTDNKEQDEANRIAEIKRFHNKRKLVEFYSQFKSNL